jgi:RimJ/RimL family protein N-acetyltransferase
VTIPERKTARLRLRAFTPADTDPLLRLMRGEQVLRYFPNPSPPHLQRVAATIEEVLDHWRVKHFGLWAVEKIDDRQLLGRCGLQTIAETGEVEIDFLLGRAHWSQGFATEAGRSALSFGFDEIRLQRVVGIVHPENLASQEVLRKLGFRLQAEAEYFGMQCLRFEVTRPDNEP